MRGASVAVSGVCLTAVAVSGSVVDFDVIDETLRRTTLGQRRVGDRVNVERAARFGDEVGGHVMSGHVWGVARATEVVRTDDNCAVTLAVDPDVIRYVLVKGFVGVDGASLTVGQVDRSARTFRVHLIPETLAVTTLGQIAVDSRCNIEVDPMTQAVVDTVERVLADRAAG